MEVFDLLQVRPLHHKFSSSNATSLLPPPLPVRPQIFQLVSQRKNVFFSRESLVISIKNNMGELHEGTNLLHLISLTIRNGGELVDAILRLGDWDPALSTDRAGFPAEAVR